MNREEEKQLMLINTMLFLLNLCESKALDYHRIFKILYFAEKKHLAKYGRMILEDDYRKLDYGPVPNSCYAIFNGVKFKSLYPEYFTNFGSYYIRANKEADTDWLSESEQECIRESYLENGNKDFGQLTNDSHRTAWASVESGAKIPTESIAKEAGVGDEMMKYILLCEENRQVMA